MNSHRDDIDDKLVHLLRTGDKHAFETIYRTYAKDLFTYALRRVRMREDCEEIVHDVFESLWKRREQLVITSLRHYLFTAVRYMVIRYFSHRGVEKKFTEHYRAFEATYDVAEEQLPHDPQTIHAQLLQHIDGLPDRCQEAIRLRLTENLSNGEIAERMQINKTTVELYISKAFGHFRASYHKIFRVAD